MIWPESLKIVLRHHRLIFSDDETVQKSHLDGGHFLVQEEKEGSSPQRKRAGSYSGFSYFNNNYLRVHTDTFNVSKSLQIHNDDDKIVDSK